ncbi:hypothetical protein [Aliikangiella coralliicola]|uniref:AP2/ERF domain-containing protein n=1 Tax=Aliikangiella coralliicola TaxID=2592383 RepID=A0A545UD32_9GAMM|nr:hypothetical protein [Aliikangiella coralliicola]TQV87368.1 hypothetical protein FLL46_13045 [Aliikangiella coralliicola]
MNNSSERELPQGVSHIPDSKRNPFRAQISINNKVRYLGSYRSPELAADAYNKVKKARDAANSKPNIDYVERALQLIKATASTQQAKSSTTGVCNA